MGAGCRGGGIIRAESSTIVRVDADELRFNEKELTESDETGDEGSERDLDSEIMAEWKAESCIELGSGDEGALFKYTSFIGE